MDRKLLQEKVRSGEIDADELLPDVVEYIGVRYYNLYANLDTGEHSASPVSRRGNPQYALRQSFKKRDLDKLIKKSHISSKRTDGIYSHLFFLTCIVGQASAAQPVPGAERSEGPTRLE